MPLNQDLQEDEVSLTSLLLVGDLDYVCQSSTSSPSTDQPGHGSSVDPRALAIH